MHVKKGKGFTLVELIVVMVILAVLAIIAFLAYANYSSTTRDSTRISDLSSIAKGLTVNAALANRFPVPDKYVIKIFSGSLQIGYQGNAGENTIRIVNGSADGFKDPLDKTYYTYNTNYTQSKYQIMAFLENPNSVAFDANPFTWLDSASAIDYSGRYPYERGDGLGIILQRSGTGTGDGFGAGIIYTPLQEIPSIQTSSGFDITDPAINSGMVAVIDNSPTSTGVTIEGLIGYTSTGNTSEDEGLDEGGTLSTISAAFNSITAGQAHTCSIKQDGTGFCWGGDNFFGQLGNNTTVKSITPSQIVGVGGAGNLSSLAQIATFNLHTCAVSTDGTAYCWGSNLYGNLGDGTTTARKVPIQLGLAGVAQIAPGGSHTCALKTDGTVYCWGYNSNSQLGDGSTTQSATPIQVKGVGGTGNLADISQLSVSSAYSCARSTAGAMYCWGLNSNRQLGDNTTTQSATPIQVKGIGGTGNLADISQISTGYSHACGVKTDGTIACWGLNSNGQLGNNSIILSGNPVNVVLPWVRNFTASQLGFGFYTSCGVQSDGSAFCWGSNNWGQVGDNVASPTNKSLPTQVVGVGGAGYLSDSSQITGSYSSTCSLKTDGTVYCWGWNGLGMLGDNTVTQRKAPVQVFGTGGVGTTLTGITQISGGNTHNCALKSNGTVYCWGDNTYGQIGDNTITQRRIPVQVMGTGGVGTTLTGITQVSAGDTHTCALKNDGTVYCWGENISGNLGINNTTNKRIPVQVLGAGGVGTTLTGVTQIFAGYYSTCALKSDKTVFCWGRNSTGQIGDGTLSAKYIPTQVKGVGGTGVLDEVVHIDGYMSVACAVKTAGTVFCWGYNYYGQLGNNTTTDESTPVQVKGGGGTGVLDGVSKIEVAYTHNCALKTDGTVHCWGRNNNGQLGDNSLNNSLTPVPTMLHSNIIWNIFN